MDLVESRDRSLQKKLIRIILGLKPYLIVILLFSLVFIAISIIKPYILLLLFDKGITNRSFTLVLRFTFFFFVIMVVSGSLTVLYDYILSSFANKFIYRIRMLLMEHMIDLPTLFFDTHSTGDIVTRINDDVEDVRNFLLFDLLAFYQAVLGFVGTSVFIGIMQWRMLVANLFVLPILVLVLRYFKKVTYKVSFETKNSQSASNQNLVEGFKNIAELKAGNYELHFLQKQSERFLDLLRRNIKTSVTFSSSSSVVQFVVNLTYLITIGYGGYLILNDQMTAGMLLAILTMRSNLVSPVQAWGNMYTRYFAIKASIDRLNNYYDEEIESGINQVENGSIPPESETLRVHDISFRFNDDRIVLERLNLEFPEGDWIGIRGPSGIGKTTLLRLALKLIQPTSGEIIYGNRTIASFNNRKWRDLIGYVSQKTSGINGSIQENILMGREIPSNGHIWTVLRICCLEEYVRTLPGQLDAVINENGSIFSEGMLKRLMLARVIVKPKRILLLDEFFSSLDIETSKQIRANLKTLLPSSTTVIVVSHREADFEHCGKIFEILKGASPLGMLNLESTIFARTHSVGEKSK